ncbi:MAG: DMT family transporter [Candidatus Tectomicrobia bacterium]|uniref:DMT family transporter n=1 Tax=Tectimicrobiota bacterium TaxID=2528274 RepID=A0A932I2A7_UNCTE|nr:DMT family transporter [Candidatus Tectomicrobia bacterium]
MGDLPIPPAEVRAVLGSFFFACNQITVRRLMDRSSAMTATLWVNAWMGVAALALSPFVDSYAGSPWLAVGMFLAVGLVGNAVARYSSYRSHMEVGVGRTNALVAASPIGAVIIGMALLGERPSPGVWLGVALVVGGMVLLTSERGGERRPLAKYTFAFMSTAAFAVTPYLRKMGLLSMDAPFLGIAISAFMANLMLLGTSRFMESSQRFRWDAEVMWGAFPSGLLAILAAVNYWTALRDGSLSVIAPLIRLGPIFVLLLSFLFLRGREVITRRVVVSTVVVVAGAALVTSGR